MNRRARPSLSLLLALGLGLAPCASWATPLATPAQHEQSRADFAAGNEAFKDGRYETARLRYQAALRNERAFDIVCNLGRTEAVVGDDALALEHLDECLKEYPVDEAVAPARQKFFHLREQVRQRCREKSCDAPASPPAASEAPAVVPAASASASSASALPPAEAAPADPSPVSARVPVTITLAALGAASLGVGIGFFAASGDSSAQAQDARSAIVARGGYCSPAAAADPACATFQDYVASARDQHTIGTVGVIAGGALLGAAVLTFLLWPAPAENTATLKWTPEIAVAPDGKSARIGLQGRF